MSLHLVIESREQPVDDGFGAADFDAPDISTRFVQLVLDGPRQYGEDAIILQWARQQGLQLDPLMLYFHAASTEMAPASDTDAWQALDALEEAATGLATLLHEEEGLLNDLHFEDPEAEMQSVLFGEYIDNDLLLQDLMLIIEQLAQHQAAGAQEVRMVLYD